MNRTHTRTARWLLFPAVAILLIGMGYPLAWQVVTSLQEFGLAQQFGQPAEFVGLANYFQLATDPAFYDDPYSSYELLRSNGRVVHNGFVAGTVDHAVANAVLRSDQFTSSALGELPGPLQKLHARVRDADLARAPTSPRRRPRQDADRARLVPADRMPAARSPLCPVMAGEACPREGRGRP